MSHPDANPVTPPLRSDCTRRTAVRLDSAGLAALLLGGSTHLRQIAAQEATPATPTGAIGTTAQVMGSGQPAAAPELELSLRRITHAPGGRVPSHSHPGALMIFVETGTWGYTSLGGSAQLTRAGAGTPTPAEALPIGTEVLLTAGDWLFVEDPQDDVRNAGDDDVVLLIAGLTRVGEPFTIFMTDMEMETTPAS